MGLTIHKKQAEAVFAKALVLAKARGALPDEWLDRSRKVGQATAKTYTPALGTALLAKACNRHVDVFSLTEGGSHKSYSARGVAKSVLVPQCVRAGINIRTTGAEPLNAQPFLRAERITRSLNVKVQTDLDYLCDCLERADFLDQESAVRALAAFLQVRIAETALIKPVPLGPGVLDLGTLEAALDDFLKGDTESGKVGQAVVAAILDLVFQDVRTRNVHDPSRTFPADVAVFRKGKQVLGAEVKQRPFAESEVLQLAERLARADVHRAVVAALRQERSPLDHAMLSRRASDTYGVGLLVVAEASKLLRQAVLFSDKDMPASLKLLPRRVLARLEELEVSEARRVEWAKHFQ